MLPALREAACRVCDGPVVEITWTQLPLVRHAGYGHAERTVLACCVNSVCGSVRCVSVASVNPRSALDGS